MSNNDDHDDHSRCRKAVFALLLACIMMFGLYYLISMPAAVWQHLKEAMSNDNDSGNFETKYQLLFTFASLPGTILPFVTGLAVNRIGARTGMLLLSIFCCLGQILASVGVQQDNWAVTLTGRFIYGLGYQSLFVTNEAFLTTIFDGTGRLGMALGASSAASYVGYLLSFIVSPVAANRIDVAFAFWLAAIVMAVSVLAALVIFVGCRDFTKGRKKVEQVHDRSSVAEPNNANLELPNEPNGTRVRLFPLTFWLISFSCVLMYGIMTRPFIQSASGILLERNLFRQTPMDCLLKLTDQCSSGFMVPDGGNPLIDDSGRACVAKDNVAPPIPRSLNITYVDPSGDESVYVFSDLQASDVDCNDAFWSEACTSNYCDRQADATKKAGMLMAVPFLVTVLTVFLFGYFGVDRAGRRAEMIMLAPVLHVVAHLLLLLRRGSPVVPLLLLGLGYSMSVSALWPSVPRTVSESAVGVAFGLMTCIQSIGYTVIPIVVAAIYNLQKRYLPEVEIFFLACSGIAFLVGMALLIFDRRSGGKLRATCPRSDAPEAGV